jgi:Tripartite tricarboxylate transporter family receptor
LEVLPDVPTVDEFVPGYEASSWFGVGAPKGTSTEIIEKLNKEIDAIVAEPNMKARLVGLGLPDVIDIRQIRKIHCRPDRKVGQGDPGGQHQAGVIRQARQNIP